MGANDLRAKIRLEGDAKGANKAIKSTDKGFRRLTQTIKAGAASQVAALGASVLAFTGLVKGIRKAITASNEQQVAINSLEGALSPLGDTASRVSVALQEQAAALQQVTTFGDETIIQAQALIASFVKDENQIKAATAATLDLAEAKGFDLVSAADLVSKTLGSSTNALTRYGIEVTGAVGSSERLTSLTENIATVFGGRAAKATETFAGKTKQLSNAWGDLFEAIGDSLTKNEEASTSIDDLTKKVVEITPAVAKFAVAMIQVATVVGKAAAAIFEFQAKIQTFIPNLIRTQKASADSAVSMEAMEAKAKKLGITVEELQTRIEGQVEANRKLNTSAREAAAATEDLATAQESAIARTSRIEAGLLKEATALDQLAAALGRVTQAELQKEFDEIATALETARNEMDGTAEATERFNTLQEAAATKMQSLQDRIDGVRRGLGDIGEQASTTGDEYDDLSESVRRTNIAFAEQASSARITRGELQSLGAAAETLALAQARAELATAQQARRRRTGGGRTASTSSTSDYGLSPFGTGGNLRVEADGNLRPA